MIAETRDDHAALDAIVRLVAERHRRVSVAPFEGGNVRDLASRVSELCSQVEYLDHSRVSEAADTMIKCSVGNDIWASYCGLPASRSVPKEGGIDDCLTFPRVDAVFPPMLRSGSFYEPCELLDKKAGIFVRSLGWRYLGALLAMNKLSGSDPGKLGSVLAGAEQSLVKTAKSQRRLRGLVFAPGEEPTGDLVALAVAPRHEVSFGSYLVLVTEFPLGYSCAEQVLRRARCAAAESANDRISHKIVMTDDMNTLLGDGCSNQEENVVLAGNPDQMRYFVFVSQIGNEGASAPAEPAKVRFRISRDKLRDAFLGVSIVEGETVTLAPPELVRKEQDSGQFLIGPSASVDGTESLNSEAVIDRERIAKAFFGYGANRKGK
ncbi:hypothetical protein ACQR1I_01715 [Bradyrhizobium sp. HKCCYLS2038]|uniref:hypothetical protein n=1 Tax=unclassified Bradyrhizobium TaxID=2631580 RepID=UPI003EBA13A7